MSESFKKQIHTELAEDILKTLGGFALFVLEKKRETGFPPLKPDMLPYVVKIASHFDKFRQAEALGNVIDLLPEEKKKELGIQ